MKRINYFQFFSFFLSIFILFISIESKTNLRNSINSKTDDSELLFVWEQFRHGVEDHGFQ